MSQSSTDRARAFAELLVVAGETMTIGAASPSAIVNRNLDPSKLFPGSLDFQDRNMSRVEFLASAVASAPRVGQSLADADGEFHRISIVQKTDITWVLFCKQTEAEE